MKISPLAPIAFPDMPPVPGVRFAAAPAGIKYKDRDDVMLAVLAPGTVVAGVFTTSATCSAAVLDCRAKLGKPNSGPAAIVVNSGNANAFTGRAGQNSVDHICKAVAGVLDLPSDRVFTASTGVIGEILPHDKIIATVPALSDALSPDGLHHAAQAIRTTDTFAKGASVSVDIHGTPITISGIAKGSGMIAPDMATMLAYVFTDAQLDHTALQDMTADLCEITFNSITVDSDTSTSDSLMVCATGASGVDVAGHDGFRSALHTVLLDLAHQIVRDGEGASKFVTVNVTGAGTNDDARKVAHAIANSPLVKTAIAGEDPNWGRIVMAVGKSGAQADRDRLSITFGDIVVAQNGWVAPTYREDDGARYMQRQDVTIGVDLGLGRGQATQWTCDFTHDYITINADYRS